MSSENILEDFRKNDLSQISRYETSRNWLRTTQKVSSTEYEIFDGL